MLVPFISEPTLKISSTAIAGSSDGSVTCHMQPSLPAPSIVAASYSSGLMPAIVAM